MSTHSCILTWRSPRTEEPGGLQSIGSQESVTTKETWRTCMQNKNKPHNDSAQFSRSVVSDSLRPHELQQPGLPVHHQLLEFTQTHVHQVSEAIQPSHPLSSPSPPAPNPSQHQSLFQSIVIFPLVLSFTQLELKFDLNIWIQF